ncbi:MAG: hypothetical protein N2053_04440 [Chitinispirillaceae bacterium]|nr:hypothetical protein [Chitinispirillaceae bacterium]
MERLKILIPIITILFNCGLFLPRDDFEPPLDGSLKKDPFNFRELLAGSGVSFSETDWSMFFDDSLRYINIRAENAVYGKSTMITHLNKQYQIYPYIKVNWMREDGFQFKPDTIILNHVRYSVIDTVMNTTISNGISEFIFIKDKSDDWHILQWLDDPEGASFFSPIRSE